MGWSLAAWTLSSLIQRNMHIPWNALPSTPIQESCRHLILLIRPQHCMTRCELFPAVVSLSLTALELLARARASESANSRLSLSDSWQLPCSRREMHRKYDGSHAKRSALGCSNFPQVARRCAMAHRTETKPWAPYEMNTAQQVLTNVPWLRTEPLQVCCAGRGGAAVPF